MSQLVVLVPVLARPHRAKPVLDAFMRTTPDVRVCFITNVDDQPEIEAIEAAGGEILCKLDGNYAEKINTGISLTDEPLIFLGADDLEPQPGWFEAASSWLQGDIGVVGINDLVPRHRVHTTHFLLTREYAQLPLIDGEPGPLCTIYAHNCVDDELIRTAVARDAYAYAGDAVVKHLHPYASNAPWDATYEKGNSTLVQDKMYWKSRRIWFFKD